jgi:hypothetical protein
MEKKKLSQDFSVINFLIKNFESKIRFNVYSFLILMAFRKCKLIFFMIRWNNLMIWGKFIGNFIV